MKKISSTAVAAVASLSMLVVWTDAAADDLKVPNLKEYRIERSISAEAKACIDCHAGQNSGIVADWSKSRHAHANVTCIDCHAATVADNDFCAEHLDYAKTKISPIVSPKDCSRCHPLEAAQYAKSKHANTLEIIWKIDIWLNDGL
ncbi:MAG: multiheme c-type cytochrome, partial [Planctomycetota bacterium]